jgi:hypothetical protein
MRYIYWWYIHKFEAMKSLHLLPILAIAAMASCNSDDTEKYHPCPDPPEPATLQLKFDVRDANGNNLFANGSLKIANLSATQACHQQLNPSLDAQNILTFPNIIQPTTTESSVCTNIYVNWSANDADTIGWTFATGGGGDCPVYYTLTGVSFKGADITAKREGQAFVITKE